MSAARLIEVIETDELRGDGTLESPMRRVRQYYSKVGVLLAEHDPIHHVGSNELHCGLCGEGQPCRGHDGLKAALQALDP